METLAYGHGQRTALHALGLTKLARAFAPGIPAQKRIAKLPTITSATKNRWTLALQDHKAKRAKRHFDLRLIDPDAGKAHSWAIPKARLPKAGEKLLAIQTYTHTPEYALNFGAKKTETIGEGYGSGTVRMALKTPTEIIEANNDRIRFSLRKGKRDREFLLRRTHDDKWLLMAASKKKAK